MTLLGPLVPDVCVHVLADKDDKLNHVVVDTTACSLIKCISNHYSVVRQLSHSYFKFCIINSTAAVG